MFSNVKSSGLGKQEKTVTASTTAIEVTPDVGKSLVKVTIKPTPSQSKTVTPSESKQTVLPPDGMLLSSVDVEAVTMRSESGTFSPSSDVTMDVSIDNPFGSAAKVKAVILCIKQVYGSKPHTVFEFIDNVSGIGFAEGVSNIPGRYIGSDVLIDVTDSTITFNQISTSYPLTSRDYSWEVIGIE